MMAINYFAFAQLFFSLSLCYAAAQIVVQTPIQIKRENVEGYELKPRSMTQLASLPEMILTKRGKQEPFHSFDQKAILLTKRSEEQQPEPNLEKKPRYLGHKRDLSETELIVLDYKDMPEEEVLLLKRTPGHSLTDLRWKQRDKEKLLKAGKHYSWMDKIPDRDDSHALVLGTSKNKREIQQPISDQLQKRFVILPPIETDKGIRFDVARDDGIVFLKRSPEPEPNIDLVSVAASSFANSFTQARNNRKKTVVLSSDSDGNITGARAINSGGSRKLINVNFVSRPRHQYQHQVY